MRHRIAVLGLLLFGIVSTSVARADNHAEAADIAAEFAGTFAREGNIIVSGQPTRAGLASAKSMGVSTIVNLRTPEEMEGEPDAADLAASLGMNHVSIPSGGTGHPYSPEAVDRFARAVENAEGNVLLHCRSGTRATHLWVAWLVKHRGVPFDEALARGRDIQFGSMPIEGYLEGEVDYSFSPSP